MSLEVLDRGGHYADPEGFPGAPLSPHQETEDRDLYRRVLEAVNTLADKNRKATLLFYYDRFSHQQIADHLGVSVAVVKSCLFRARAQLADLLGPLYPEFSVTRESRSKPMIELTVASVVPLSLDGYYAVLLLDKAGRRVLTMTVSRPTSSLVQESLRLARDRSSQSSEGAKILVVDDEFAMREVLGEFLSNLGYVVLEAHNGLSALERIEQESPDLVLLNIAMPRVGGIEVLRWLKARHTHSVTPAVLVISGSANSTEVLEAGADDFLSKPVSLKHLAERVESLLDIQREEKASNAPTP